MSSPSKEELKNQLSNNTHWSSMKAFDALLNAPNIGLLPLTTHDKFSDEKTEILMRADSRNAAAALASNLETHDRLTCGLVVQEPAQELRSRQRAYLAQMACAAKWDSGLNDCVVVEDNRIKIVERMGKAIRCENQRVRLENASAQRGGATTRSYKRQRASLRSTQTPPSVQVLLSIALRSFVNFSQKWQPI